MQVLKNKPLMFILAYFVLATIMLLLGKMWIEHKRVELDAECHGKYFTSVDLDIGHGLVCKTSDGDYVIVLQ